MRFIGRRERVSRARCSSRWTGPRPRRPATTASRCFVAFNYGGRAEILDAAARYQGGGEEAFRRLLYAPEMHDPDLIIRTSGEQRHVQLPAVAVARTPSSSSPTSCGRTSRARRSRRRWPSTSAARAGSAGADGARRRAAAPRAQRRDAAARSWARGCSSRCPAIAFAIFIVVPGRRDLRASASAALGLVCLHELFAMYPQARPGAAGRLPRARWASWPRRSTATATRSCWPSWPRSR